MAVLYWFNDRKVVDPMCTKYENDDAQMSPTTFGPPIVWYCQKFDLGSQLTFLMCQIMLTNRYRVIDRYWVLFAHK